VLRVCAVDVRVLLIPNVCWPIILYAKEHIDILLVVSLSYCFDDNGQESRFPHHEDVWQVKM
jgi:hypothetical protein